MTSNHSSDEEDIGVMKKDNCNSSKQNMALFRQKLKHLDTLVGKNKELPIVSQYEINNF